MRFQNFQHLLQVLDGFVCLKWVDLVQRFAIKFLAQHSRRLEHNN